MRLWREDRGDTLIEVTMALAILASVLTGAFMAASGAFRLGQTAKERSQLSSVAQRQAEALSNFRDSHTWAEFENGGGTGPSRFNGIDVRIGANCQPYGMDCFHMERRQIGGVWQWVPQQGSLGTTAEPSLPATGSVSIVGTPVTLSGGVRAYKFTIFSGNTIVGRDSSARNSNKLVLQLVNMDGLR